MGDDAYDSLDEAGAAESESVEDEAEEMESGESGDECDLSAAFVEPLGVCPILFRSLKRAGVQTEEAIRMLKEYHEFQQAMPGNSRS